MNRGEPEAVSLVFALIEALDRAGSSHLVTVNGTLLVSCWGY